MKNEDIIVDELKKDKLPQLDKKIENYIELDIKDIEELAQKILSIKF